MLLVTSLWIPRCRCIHVQDEHQAALRELLIATEFRVDRLDLEVVTEYMTCVRDQHYSLQRDSEC